MYLLVFLNISSNLLLYFSFNELKKENISSNFFILPNNINIDKKAPIALGKYSIKCSFSKDSFIYSSHSFRKLFSKSKG